MTDPGNPTATAPSSPPASFEEFDQLTPDQVTTMAQWAKEDLLKGKISSEKATAIFNELGTPAEQ